MTFKPGLGLYIQWSQEELEKNEEREHGGNRAKGWRKVVRSMKDFTGPVNSPDDLLPINGVGPTTIAALRKRARQYYKAIQQPVPADLGDSDSDKPKKGNKRSKNADVEDDSAVETQPKKKAKPVAKKAAATKAKRAELTMDDIDFGSSETEDDGKGESTAKCSKGKGKAKEVEKGPKTKKYMPKSKTGAYALLVAFVTLINEQKDLNAQATQDTLQKLAAPYSKTSFTSKTGGNRDKSTGAPGYYSAWNGMKNLVEKDYVKKIGRAPIHYTLQPAGIAPANIAAEAEGVEPIDVAGSANGNGGAAPSDSEDSDDQIVEKRPAKQSARTPVASTSRKQIEADATSVEEFPGLDQARPPKLSIEGAFQPMSPLAANLSARTDNDTDFRYIFLKQGDMRTVWRDQAQTFIDELDDFKTVYKIEYQQSQRSHQAVLVGVLEGDVDLAPRPDGNTKAGWLREAVADIRAPGLPDAGPTPSSSGARLLNPRQAAAEAAMRRANGVADPTRDSLMGNEQRVDPDDKRAMYKPPGRTLGTSSSAANLGSSQAAPRPAPQRTASSSSIDVVPPVAGPSRVKGPRASLNNSSATATAFDPAHLVDSAPTARANILLPKFDPQSDALVMRPGEFTVEVVVDVRENSVLRSVSSQVKAYTESLSVGDFVWVAKRKVPTGIPERDVFVLDAVLERKRLDDLFASMKNGRLDEQKARIKQSGTTRRMYMIEIFKVKEHANFEQQFWTISSQTQISDGFLMQWLHSAGEGADHVIRCTKVMAALHKDTTLYAIPDRFVERASYIPLQDHLRRKHPSTPYLTSFDAFQRINRKQHSVGTGWANMLFRQNGMSAEKSCDIVDLYPTPFACRQAIKQQLELVKEEPLAKKRKEMTEKFFESNLKRDMQRSRITGTMGKFLWDLFAVEDYSTVKATKP